MTSNFYRAFEDRYRGSRELIKKRLEAYSPFTEILARIYPGAPTLDLGCGRGEWLELMNEQGFDASGVDLDEGMLAACMERGMQVKNADALSTLKELPDNSIAIVSAFHLVEHLPFVHVETLIAQALRVLRPGGLLIMETPNPENLIVGTNNFYLDPSHERPIPSLLLDFLVEFLGFPRRKVVRLTQEINTSEELIGLKQVAEQVSPDYGLVAQKAAEAAIAMEFDTPFDKSYGPSFIEMAERFDAQGLRMRSETNHELSMVRQELAENKQDIGLLSEELAETKTALTQMHASLIQLSQTGWTKRIASFIRRQRLPATGTSETPPRTRHIVPRRLASTIHTLLLHASKSRKIRKVLIPALNRYPQLRTKLLYLIKRETNNAARTVDFSADWPTPLPSEYQYMSESTRKILLDLARTCGNSHS